MERTHTVMPFILAMLIAVARMPTNVYQICRSQVGTLEIEPWLQTSADAVVSTVRTFFSRMRLGWMIPIAAAVIFALFVADLQSAHAGVLVATVVAGTTDLTELRERINKLGTDMSAIVAKAGEEKRELTADEERTFDGMDADREKLLATETRLLKVEQLNGSERRTEHVQPGEHRANHSQHAGRKVEISAMDRMEGIRSWLLAGSDATPNANQREIAQRVGIDLNSRRVMLQLPTQALRSLHRDDIKAFEERAQSTMSSSSPVDGYYTIANEMMRPLEVALLAFGGIRQVATVLRTETGAELPIPTANDTSNTGEILAENTQVNQQDVAFNQLVLNAFKYSSKMILVSTELLQDSAVNLAEFLGRALGERIGRITNTHFTTGDASSKPNGIVTASTASGVQLAAKTPTYAEMVQIQHSVDPSYRVNAGWMFHDSMLSEVKQIVDASTGRPIWVPNMAGGAPDTILGDRYVVNQAMAVAAGSGAAKSILYGELSKYLVRDVRGLTLLRLDERFADYGQVAFLAFSRHDGDLLDAGTHPVKHALNKS